MTKVVLLDNQAHRDLCLAHRPASDSAQRFVPVVVSEFSRLATQCPIFLSKDVDTGAFYCGAMLGFDEAQNLLAADWEAYQGYRPLNLRRRPFFLSNDQLAIDLDDPMVGGAGDRLFEPDGSPSDRLQAVRHVFEELRENITATRTFIDDLVKHRLLTPIEIDLAFDDGAQQQLQDLYTIDQAALLALPEEIVLDWFKQGRLFLIDTMILSVRQVSALANRRNRVGAVQPVALEDWAR